jgi:hypothetical protein
VQEFWQPARFNFHTGIDFDIHDPYTDAFHKKVAWQITGDGGLQGAHPSGKGGLMII